MPAIRNIFACLVHESPDCVIDLVRNLRALDPGSLILLYNGGRDPNLPRHDRIVSTCSRFALST